MHDVMFRTQCLNFRLKCNGTAFHLSLSTKLLSRVIETVTSVLQTFVSYPTRAVNLPLFKTFY